MKKILLLLALLAVLAAGPTVTVDNTTAAVAVPCCIKGTCRYLTAEACHKSGGRVVDNCDRCRR